MPRNRVPTTHARVRERRLRSRFHSRDAALAAVAPPWFEAVGEYLHSLDLPDFELGAVCEVLVVYGTAEWAPHLTVDQVEAINGIIARNGRPRDPAGEGP